MVLLLLCAKRPFVHVPCIRGSYVFPLLWLFINLLFTDQKKKVCKLKKALYGLKQSPRAWFG